MPFVLVVSDIIISIIMSVAVFIFIVIGVHVLGLQSLLLEPFSLFFRSLLLQQLGWNPVNFTESWRLWELSFRPLLKEFRLSACMSILLLLLLLLLLLHPFNGHFSRTTWVCWCQKCKTSLDFSEARDDGGGVWDGSGISWTICKQPAPRCRQITTTTPYHSIFTGRMLFLTCNQQCQSTDELWLSSRSLCVHIWTETNNVVEVHLTPRVKEGI